MRPWKGGRRGQVTETVALTLGNSSIWRILSRGLNFPSECFTSFPYTAVERKKRCSSTCFDAIAIIQAQDGSSLEQRTGDKVVRDRWDFGFEDGNNCISSEVRMKGFVAQGDTGHRMPCYTEYCGSHIRV